MVSTSRAIATSTLWQLSSQIVMAALSIVTTKFVAVGLSQELAGTYNTTYGYLQLFGILADFGLYAVAVRELSKAENREKVLGGLLVLRGCTLILSLGTALLFVWLLPHWRGTPLPLAVTIASFVPFFTQLAGMLRTSFQIAYRMHFVFVAEVLQRVITMSLTGIFILMGIRQSTDVRILFAFLLIGGIGACILFLISIVYGGRITRIRLNFDPKLLRHLFAQAAPYGLAFFCTAFYRQFDVTLIALLRTDFELQNAFYGFVQRMMDMGYLLPTFLLNSALPLLASRHSAGEDTKNFLGKIFLAILLLGTTCFLFAFFWARPLTSLLTTNAYLSTIDRPGSDTALRILSLSMFFNVFILFAFYVLLTQHRWKPLVLSLFLGVILSVVLNLWLIPYFGFVGSSFASTVVHGFLALLLLPQSIHSMPFRISIDQVFQWIAFSILLVLPLIFLAPLLTRSLLTAIALGGMGVWLLLIGRLMGLDREMRR